MPAKWRIKKVKGNYYLYHYNKCVGNVEKIIELYEKAKEVMAPGAGFEPARGNPHRLSRPAP